jgi:hypothetical protein
MSSRRWRRGGTGDRVHVQTVEEVRTEPPRLHILRQIAVRRSNDSYVGPNALSAANALELAVLKNAQQLRLKLDW